MILADGHCMIHAAVPDMLRSLSKFGPLFVSYSKYNMLLKLMVRDSVTAPRQPTGAMTDTPALVVLSQRVVWRFISRSRGLLQTLNFERYAMAPTHMSIQLKYTRTPR
jgi:hypothetical protein